MDNTQRGFSSRRMRNEANSARSIIHGAAMRVIKFFPRTPDTGTVRSATLRAGTSFVSIPLDAPSHNTGTLRARKASATARPGKIWPPVPPAMIMIGAGAVSFIYMRLPDVRLYASARCQRKRIRVTRRLARLRRSMRVAARSHAAHVFGTMDFETGAQQHAQHHTGHQHTGTAGTDQRQRQ